MLLGDYGTLVMEQKANRLTSIAVSRTYTLNTIL